MITKKSIDNGINPIVMSLVMLRKMSIIPVALIAMYLFSCSVKSQNEDNTVHSFVDVQVKPMFNGKSADEAFREYINPIIVYPLIAAEHGIQGRVVVEFVIEKDGSLSNVTVVQGADPLLDNEALRVINSSPQWTPGKHNGKLARVSYHFPISFTLK